MTARSVDDRTTLQRIAAMRVEPEPTGIRRTVALHRSKRTDDTSPPTPKNDDSGSIPGNSESVSESPTFSPSDAPSNVWTQPRNVREFAAQTNTVATMVLRGQIDLERARVYSGLARTVAQAMSTEVSRARFLAQEPDLSLEND